MWAISFKKVTGLPETMSLDAGRRWAGTMVAGLGKSGAKKDIGAHQTSCCKAAPISLIGTELAM